MCLYSMQTAHFQKVFVCAVAVTPSSSEFSTHARRNCGGYKKSPLRLMSARGWELAGRVRLHGQRVTKFV